MSGGLGSMFHDLPASIPGRQAGLQRKVDALHRAAQEARGRVDDALLDDVEATATRSAERLGLSSEHTVVAIAGSTGSGKSTTFNALAGMELSDPGAQRPMTSVAKALVWSDDDSDELRELLEWLGVPRAHQFHRSELSSAPPRHALPEGLILLDLPDHDSIQTAHHRESERIVALADALIWVVDPQKYADAAIHHRFLRPLAGHRDVTMVVLNHIDEVPEEERPGLMRDLRKLLVADGMRDPRILGMSAKYEVGVGELRQAVRRRVEERRNAENRVSADIAAAAARLQASTGDAPVPIPDAWIADVERRVTDAAGVPGAVARAERATRAAGLRRLSWPWPSADDDEETGSRSTDAGAVDRPAVNAAVRALTDQVCRDLTEVWAGPVRAAATARLDETNDRLDAELAAVRVDAAVLPDSRVVGASRLVGVAAVVGGLVCLGVAAWLGIALLTVGLLVGVGGHLAARAWVERASTTQAMAVEERHRAAVALVVRAHVLEPVHTELVRFGRCRAAIKAAGPAVAAGSSPRS